MNMPGFTAEVSVHRSTGRYSIVAHLVDSSRSFISPALILSAPARRLPIPFPDPLAPCDACIIDCIHRGGDPLSCFNLCSWICF
jgi:hypothetical protein